MSTNTSGYTPGPWRIEDQLYVWGKKHAIATAYKPANAYVIAAVPDLIAALRACVGALEQELGAAGELSHPMIRAHAAVARKGRAAIRKATGHP